MLFSTNYQESQVFFMGLIIFGGVAVVVGVFGGWLLYKTKGLRNTILFVAGSLGFPSSFFSCYFLFCDIADLLRNFVFWLCLVLIGLGIFLPSRTKDNERAPK